MLIVALPGPLIALALRRPRRETLSAAALMAGAAGLAFGVPVLRFGADLMKRQGFLIALSVPESWRSVYESVLFGGMSPAVFAAGGFLEVLFPSALGIALLLLLPGGDSSRSWFLSAVLFAAGGLTFFSPGNAWLHALLPLAACLGALGLARAALRLRGGPRADPATVGIVLVMLPALLRQPLFLRNPVYGAFSAPLALVVALCWLGRRTRSPKALTAFVLGLSVAQAVGRIRGIGLAEMKLTRLPGATLFLVPQESRFVAEAARVIREVVPDGGTIGIFPEPGFLLFVTDRRNPFVDELFVPGIQDAAAEDLMIRRLRERPPDALLVTNRAYPEFGQEVYGNGLLDRFFLEVSRRYVPVRRIAGDAGPVLLRHASEGTLFVPRGDGVP
jgi:hypothetical protein